MPTSSRLVFTCEENVKAVLITKESILWSSTLAVFHSLPGLMYCLLKNGADCRFSLSDRFILIFQLNDIILNLHRHLFGFHIETSTEPNASSALGINSRSFVCLICLEIMREQAALGQEAACHPITFETFELKMLRSEFDSESFCLSCWGFLYFFIIVANSYYLTNFYLCVPLLP